MRTIIRITHIEKRAKDGKPYIRTYVILDDGSEAYGYGKFSVGDKVQHFYHGKWDKNKIRK